MMLIAFTLTFIGFASLSLSMKRHYAQLRPTVQQHRPLLPAAMIGLRCVGYLCLAAGMLCVASESIAVGLVLWSGLLTAAALLQSLLLTYLPRRIVYLGIILVVACLAFLSPSG